MSASQIASGVDYASMGFAAQHSRSGLKGSAGEKIKVGGTLELDFYWGGFDANARPRMRLAYASMSNGNLELRFGQQWDIFSPINATTNNTNGNMWYTGNRGFRRAQIQLHYNIPIDGLAPLLQLSLGEASKEATDLGADNKSGVPMIQGRLSANLMKETIIGLYFVYATFDPNPHTDNDDYSTAGFGIDFNIPFRSMLTVKGEFNTGTNLENSNLFTIAGNGAYDDDRKSMGLWFHAIAKPSSTVNFVLGYGMDKNQTNNLVSGTIEQNTAFYGDVIFPIGNGFSIALELENISTKIKDGDTNSSLIFDVAGKIDF